MIDNHPTNHSQLARALAGTYEKRERKIELSQAHRLVAGPPLKVGDKFQVGTLLASGETFWGSIQTVLRLRQDGTPYYRPKHAKVDKVPDVWRLPDKSIN